jgi:hypothetical protein
MSVFSARGGKGLASRRVCLYHRSCWREDNAAARNTVGPGLHRIVVEYWNELAEGRVQLSWKLGTGEAERLVPAEALWHVPEAGH